MEWRSRQIRVFQGQHLEKSNWSLSLLFEAFSSKVTYINNSIVVHVSLCFSESWNFSFDEWTSQIQVKANYPCSVVKHWKFTDRTKTQLFPQSPKSDPSIVRIHLQGLLKFRTITAGKHLYPFAPDSPAYCNIWLFSHCTVKLSQSNPALAVIGFIYSLSGKYSNHFNFSIFCYITVLFQNELT